MAMVYVTENENKRLRAEVERLKEEIEHYKNNANNMQNLIAMQHDTIDMQHKIFMLNQAEIQRLREQHCRCVRMDATTEAVQRGW